jgi:hypothetical protein
LVNKLPQILAGLFEAKDGGEHVPKDKIHADEHVDDVKEDTIAQGLDLVNTTFEISTDVVDRFYYRFKPLIDRFYYGFCYLF